RRATRHCQPNERPHRLSSGDAHGSIRSDVEVAWLRRALIQRYVHRLRAVVSNRLIDRPLRQAGHAPWLERSRDRQKDPLCRRTFVEAFTKTGLASGDKVEADRFSDSRVAVRLQPPPALVESLNIVEVLANRKPSAIRSKWIERIRGRHPERVEVG